MSPPLIVLRTGLVTSVFVLTGALGAGAQIPGLAKSPSAPDSQPAQVVDPLGRTSPRGTIAKFTEAVQRNDLVSATRFLELTPALTPGADTLARKLSDLLDRYFAQAVAGISGATTGALDDGLPPDRERLGPLMLPGRSVDVMLTRIEDPQAGPVWLVSTETLIQVPALHRQITETWVERLMPPFLVRRQLFGTSLAHWVALAGSLALPFVVLMALSGLAITIARKRIESPDLRRRLEKWYAGLRWPAILIVSLLFHLSVARFMGLPLTFRLWYGRIALVASVAAVAWFVRRLLGLSFDRARDLIPGSSYSGTRSLLLLAERLVKAFVVVVAVLLILTIAGVDAKTALTGLGIGGLAIALGAQKTVENLLGGLFLLSDKALAVGDVCVIANRQGTVEDITLRSVRLRTMEQTLLSIPAGTLSQSNVENFSARGKILMQNRLRLRYGTSAEQIRSALAAIGRLLAEHPKLERGTSRARLVDFSERAVEVELFAYALTSDGEEFLRVREDVLLAAASAIESSGSGFAHPTQFVYMDGSQPGEAPVPVPTVRDGDRSPGAATRAAATARDQPGPVPGSRSPAT